MLRFHAKKGNVAELLVGGPVTGADYERVRPEFERFAEEHERIRLLLEVRELQDVGIRAVLEDLKLTTEYLRAFERVAVVSDVGWQQSTAEALGALMPADVESWDLADRADAEAWLTA